MHRKITTNELRCVCSRHPLLATYGLTQDGKVYIHIKIFKQQRIFGEVIITEGKVSLHCRECLRWHKVSIRQQGDVRLIEETDLPTLAAGS